MLEDIGFSYMYVYIEIWKILKEFTGKTFVVHKLRNWEVMSDIFTW